MKNGCCRDCMKAFSKNGKVRIHELLIYRVVYAKFLSLREDQHYLSKDVNTVVVRGVTR